MPRFPDAGEKETPARRTSPMLLFFAGICLALIVAYLGNAAWNLIHLSRYDASQLLAAATLPAPVVAQPLPRWSALASAAVFLLLLVLATTCLRAIRRTRRRKPAPYAQAETADVFIADPTRNALRPPPISLSTPGAAESQREAQEHGEGADGGD